MMQVAWLKGIDTDYPTFGAANGYSNDMFIYMLSFRDSLQIFQVNL